MAIFCGTPMLIAAILWGLANLLFLLVGRKTTGRIVGEQVNSTEHGNPTYSPIVEFQDENGRLVKFTAKLGVSRGFITISRVGNTVRVVYAPWNPSRARIANFQNLFLLPFVFTAVGIFIVVYDYKSVLLAVQWLVRLVGGL